MIRIAPDFDDVTPPAPPLGRPRPRRPIRRADWDRSFVPNSVSTTWHSKPAGNVSSASRTKKWVPMCVGCRSFSCGTKNRARLLFRQGFRQRFPPPPPRRAIFPARNRIDILPIRTARPKPGGNRTRPRNSRNRSVRRAILPPSVTANVDDVPLRFTQQPQRQSADDALVVRMRRENQCFRRVVRRLSMPREFLRMTRRQLFSTLEKPRVVRTTNFRTGFTNSTGAD